MLGLRYLPSIPLLGRFFPPWSVFADRQASFGLFFPILQPRHSQRRGLQFVWKQKPDFLRPPGCFCHHQDQLGEMRRGFPAEMYVPSLAWGALALFNSHPPVWSQAPAPCSCSGGRCSHFSRPAPSFSFSSRPNPTISHAGPAERFPRLKSSHIAPSHSLQMVGTVTVTVASWSSSVPPLQSPSFFGPALPRSPSSVASLDTLAS